MAKTKTSKKPWSTSMVTCSDCGSKFAYATQRAIAQDKCAECREDMITK